LGFFTKRLGLKTHICAIYGCQLLFCRYAKYGCKIVIFIEDNALNEVGVELPHPVNMSLFSKIHRHPKGAIV